MRKKTLAASKIYSFFLLIVLSCVFMIPAFAGNSSTKANAAAQCADVSTKLKKTQERSDQLRNLIERNNQRLKVTSQENYSARIKLQSNVFIAQTRIEALTDQISLINNEMKQKGCE